MRPGAPSPLPLSPPQESHTSHRSTPTHHHRHSRNRSIHNPHHHRVPSRGPSRTRSHSIWLHSHTLTAVGNIVNCSYENKRKKKNQSRMVQRFNLVLICKSQIQSIYSSALAKLCLSALYLLKSRRCCSSRFCSYFGCRDTSSSSASSCCLKCMPRLS